MDEKVVTAIHELANALAGLGSWQQQLVSLAILVVVAGAGSFFGAYLKTRATNAAMADDLEEIKRQLRETTATAETIKSRIGKRSEFNTLRIAKLEELMAAYIESFTLHHLAYTKLLESGSLVIREEPLRVFTLTKFYFPELDELLIKFFSDWADALRDLHKKRQAVVEHAAGEHVEYRLAEWEKNGFPEIDAVHDQAGVVVLALVSKMHELLAEGSAKGEAGHAPA